MGRLIDMTGQRYGRLVVLGYEGTHYSKGFNAHSTWRCKCDCGKEIVVIGNNLRTGNTKSCGCLVAEKSTERIKKYYADRRANSIQNGSC